MTADEYAAIGRRVAACYPDVEYSWKEADQMREDRDALWELCQRLMAKWQRRFPTMDRAALLESLG